MMMKKNKYLLPLLLVASVVAMMSCKKDYIIGGKTTDPHVNMTTYDYLKTNPLFDTVLLLIDRTGLKDEVNAAGTFFCITDYDISNYIQYKQADLQVKKNDENYVYTFDSLDYTSLKDSLRAYMFKDKITRDVLNESGRYFQANDGEVRMVRLVENYDYTNGTVFTDPAKYIFLSKIVAYGTNPPPVTTADSVYIPNLVPQQYLDAQCQTTGILTTTGVLHVLNNNHTFTFYADIHN
jgi:hypothetical protein